MKVEIVSDDFTKENIEEKPLLAKTVVNDLGKLIQKEVSQYKIEKKVTVYKETFIDKIKKEIGFDWNIKADWENFIGTNLINKIGILILIFGVIVGAKYSIDNNLINPLTRIIIGYTISLILLATSIKLKDKYLNFSAVLLSGSLATLYFLSFMAYDFYGFIDQTTSFTLMFVFTIFAVVASLSYNKKIIALIGLVGSYAIPFLLSNDSGNVLFLFSYMAIVNIGILILSFKKNWKLLYYVAFIFTWLIYIFWFGNSYQESKHFILALFFLAVFYITFYITFLAYKLIKNENFVKSDIIFIMLNSFVFYALGMGILSGHNTGKDYLGLFTVLNAVVHFVVSKIIFNKKEGDKKLFYLAIVMVLIFITMAIPVQLNGAWIALFWSLEAGLLFWVGRTKKIAIYERMSYALIALAFIGIMSVWSDNYFYKNLKPFFNVNFITSIIASISFGFMTKLIFQKEYETAIEFKTKSTSLARLQNFIYKSIKFIIPTLFIIILYNTFANEIFQFFEMKFEASIIKKTHLENNWTESIYNYDILSYKTLFLIFYSILFTIIASLLNLKYFKNKFIALLTLVASVLMLFVSLSVGLLECSELRESYLMYNEESLYSNNIWDLMIRYINYAFIGALVFTIYKIIKEYFNTIQYKQYFWLGFHVVVLWILSSELLHWMDFYGNKNAYKISITILWASYSLFAIALGIWKKHKFLRIGAITLFAITLGKLFLYDLSDLSTIHKTIVLISVGILLLIVSFLYNKFTATITEENELK